MRRAIAIAIVMAARPAAADPVDVEVVDVAGDVAYLEPGKAAGIVPGTKVQIRGVELVVDAVTEKTAVVKLGTQSLAVGDRGTADVTPGAAVVERKLPPPRSPQTFVDQWGPPVLPASTQHPEPVLLGSGRPTGRARVTVLGTAFAGIGDATAASGEGRVIASFDAMSDRPLTVDLDVAGRAFSEGYDKRTRTPALVRVAQLRYGDANDPRFALGRLRYAATSVGMLDGGRAALRFGDVQVGAFGGIVPDPLSGKPDTGAARFGGEVVYDARDTEWQPRLAVTAYGSTWDGAVDERRLAVAASAGRDAWWFDGWAEGQAFPADNPWHARRGELTGAGASAEWRKHGAHAGVDLGFLRPERSLRLAAALPLEWLCTVTSEIGDTSTTCATHDHWESATGSAGIRRDRFSIDAVGSVGRSRGMYIGYDASGYLRGELRFGSARAIAAVSGGTASFAGWVAGEIGGGYAPSRRYDVSVRYREERLDYVAGTGPLALHSVIADGHLALSPALDLGSSAIVTTGEDRDALAILGVVVWRPLP